jgi:hypothetical protein
MILLVLECTVANSVHVRSMLQHSGSKSGRPVSDKPISLGCHLGVRGLQWKSLSQAHDLYDMSHHVLDHAYACPPPPHLPPPHLSQPGGGKAHRDSKTDNLLYDHDTGMFVTIDFGLYLLLSGKGFYVAGTPGELGPTPHNELRA